LKSGSEEHDQATGVKGEDVFGKKRLAAEATKKKDLSDLCDGTMSKAGASKPEKKTAGPSTKKKHTVPCSYVGSKDARGEREALKLEKENKTPSDGTTSGSWRKIGDDRTKAAGKTFFCCQCQSIKRKMTIEGNGTKYTNKLSGTERGKKVSVDDVTKMVSMETLKGK